MNGLRVFINEAQVVAATPEVFYSRRGEGPYYHWSYEHTREQWRPVRVPSDQLPHLTLCASNWKSLPSALQRSLVEHYVD